MLATTRGLAATAASVFVTRGSQMALHLTALALLAPEDRVAVEALGYRQAREAFRAAGAQLVSIPIDQHGLDVQALQAAHDTAPIRAVYLTSHHQFPTTVSLSPSRRVELLAFACRERIAVIEDDYDHEFHYEGRPLLPMASADRHGSVIYIGSLSKVLAPGLRIGYVVAPVPFIQQLAAYRALVDMHGDHAIEYAVAELIEDGELQRHVRRTRREYAKRRLILAEQLTQRFGDRVSFSLPTGGTGIWVRAHHGIDVEDWLIRANDGGVAFETARSFTFNGDSRPFVRLGFAALNEREIMEGTRRLLAGWPTEPLNRAPTSANTLSTARR